AYLRRDDGHLGAAHEQAPRLLQADGSAADHDAAAAAQVDARHVVLRAHDSGSLCTSCAVAYASTSTFTRSAPPSTIAALIATNGSHLSSTASSGVIASTGHSGSHAPQSMHSTGSITSMRAVSMMQSTGQTSTQVLS